MVSKDDTGLLVSDKKHKEHTRKDRRLHRSNPGCVEDAYGRGLATIAERADSPFVMSAGEDDEGSDPEEYAEEGQEEEEEESGLLDDDNDEPPAMHAGMFFARAHASGHVPRESAAVRVSKGR